MLLTTLLLLSPADAGIFAGRHCTHSSGLRYASSISHGGAMPAPGAVVASERWWYGEALLGETLRRYLDAAPEPTLTADWRRSDTARSVPQGFGEVTSRQRVTLSRVDGLPLSDDLGPSLTVTMTCTDRYEPPRP